MLLNKKAVRNEILCLVRTFRPGWKCDRVSEQVYGVLDHHLNKVLLRAVRAHRSSGQTFRDICVDNG